jgi:hypothetical protein
MCVGLETMAIASLVMSAASTGMSYLGSQQQGKAAKQQADYQAQVSRNNAQVAEWQAEDSQARGKIEEDQHRRKVQQLIGSQKAGISGSGFELGDDTSQSIIGDTAMFGELDALTIRNNAEREAWGYRVQGSNYTADAGLMTARGQSAQSAAKMQGYTDLLGGASKFASGYSTSAKKFGWGSV